MTVRRPGRLAAGSAAIALLSTALIAGPSLGAQAGGGNFPATPGSPGVGDVVYPNLGNGGYQADRYELDLKYDAATRLVAGHVKILATTTQNLSAFNLDSFGLDITELRVNGSTELFRQEGEELVVSLEWPIRTATKFVIDVSYTADPRKIKPPAGGWVATPDGFATAPQPAGAHTIFPGNDHPSDKADYVIRVTAPQGTIGVASGKHVGDQVNADGSTTSTYQTLNPMATELVQASVGDYTIIRRNPDAPATDPVLRDVVPTARIPKVDAALKLTAGQLDWLTQRLGAFPLEAYGILPANNDAADAFDFTGLETQTLTLYKPNYLAQTEDKIGSHMMHELAHSYFGNSLTPASWSDLWFNEGHADYYGLIYRYERGWPDTRGYTTMVDRMKFTYSQGDLWRKSSGPVAKPNAQNLFDNQRYTGGVLVLYALAEKIGQDKFHQIEQAALSTHRNSTISTEQYITLATTVSGDAGVRPFLEDWLYGTKTPPMPNHPDWTVVAPTAKALRTANVQSDRLGN
ncbi:M1 family metallopeptidase [Kribbella antibiotica]|uniref:M1 family metallopeptidase n=1 Tax=Kribbella antibiotica TaxID=190195 RepID=UPI00192D9CDD|nr:M1 family metallopeptidase [Kribbella antibiotica]